jgi:hypothetical protein
MEGGAPAAPSTGVAPDGGSDSSSEGVGEYLTSTESIPIPVAPYAMVRYSRRFCFNESAKNCRR